MVNEIFAFFVSTDSNSLLREELVALTSAFRFFLLVSVDHFFDFVSAHIVILVDVPNFENPVSVQSVDSTTSLVTDHIDDGVVLKRRASAKVHRVRNLFGSSHIELTELVLIVKEHYLPKRVNGLERLRLDTLYVELELQDKREHKLGNRSVLEVMLNFSADSK